MTCVSRLGDHIEAYLVAREALAERKRCSLGLPHDQEQIKAAEKELAWRLQVLNAMPGMAVRPGTPTPPLPPDMFDLCYFGGRFRGRLSP